MPMNYWSLGAALIAFLQLSCATASLAQSVGETSFENTGAPAAQAEFARGLAQLHNFEYDDAAGHFRKAQEIDAAFAMAYWGEAMTKNHPVWHQQDREAGREVLKRLGTTAENRAAKAKTDREKLYLQAVEILYGDGAKADRDREYEAAMEGIHTRYPDDVDATSFYALSILGSAQHGRDFTIYMRAAAVLEEVFPSHRTHPGVVHYLIHSYDDAIHAPLGLRAARIYSQIAPDAGHAQHMTSHIFLALGMWDEVIKANETAMAVVNHHRAALGKAPWSCGHYGEWLHYAYLQRGRTEDARAILIECREEVGQEVIESKKPGAAPKVDKSMAESFTQMRTDFLINSQLWGDVAATWDFPDLADHIDSQLTFDFATALSELKQRDAHAHERVARFEDTRRQFVIWNAKQESPDESADKRAEILSGELKALLEVSRGHPAKAIDRLKKLALREHALPVEFGPPFINKPVDELLGEILLEQHDLGGAHRAFTAALAGAPGRRVAGAGLEASRGSTSGSVAIEVPAAAKAAHH
jgi:tetratricopeptide (TPR) repeat protein